MLQPVLSVPKELNITHYCNVSFGYKVSRKIKLKNLFHVEISQITVNTTLPILDIQELLDDAESCKRRMTAASALIGGLAGEKIRWTEQSKQFKSQIERYSCHLEKLD